MPAQADVMSRMSPVMRTSYNCIHIIEACNRLQYIYRLIHVFFLSGFDSLFGVPGPVARFVRYGSR